MKITGVTNQKQVEIKDLPAAKLGIDFMRRARNNNRKVNIFSFNYISSGNKINGVLVAPKKIPVSKSLPCVIFNRGGYKDFGEIKPAMMFTRLADIAKKGYVIIGSQNIGDDRAKWTDEYGSDKDIKKVLDLYSIIKKNSFIDSKRIGMLGGSRGGITTYRSLTKVRWIKTAVVYAGAADLVRGNKLRSDIKGVFKESFGGSKREMEKRSVLYWVNKLPKKIPILLMHGTADWRVTPLDSIDLARKLYQNKIPYRLVIFEGADHGLTEFREESTQMMIDWFNRFLKTKNALLPNLNPHGL